jgi:glycosyltransferase involved in cell wall biosynthesis
MMQNKIKLIIVTNILDIGGAERTVQTLALYLDKSTFDVTVLCLLRGGPRVQLLEERGARVLVGDGTIEKIKQLIPKSDFDILHFHRSGQNENWLHQAVVEYLQPKKLMETNIFAFSDPMLGSRFDLQVYKSMMMLSQRVWKGANQNPDISLKQRVIYNPVTTDYFDQFRLSGEQRQAMRSDLGIKPDDIVLGRIGRNDTVKWGDLILAALPVIFRHNPKVKFLFRTVPTARLSWLKKSNFFDGRVIVLPESSSEKEIAETYQMLDIYVHTSRRGEAFGNSLNEAMVWSLPIIVENTPHWDNGQLEQVDNGKTGWVIHSVGGLAAAVSDLKDNYERRIAFGKAGRQKVLDCFDRQRGVAQYELAYRQLAGLKTDTEVLAQIYPSADNLVAYHKKYAVLSQLDFPHQTLVWFELKRKIQYWYWRVFDSLAARGFIKLK